LIILVFATVLDFLFPALRQKVLYKIDDLGIYRDKNVPTIRNRYRHQ